MVLGVTGGIATGKSSVAAMFGKLGAVVVSADELSRQAVAAGTETLDELVRRFGRKILSAEDELDRGVLSDIVFSDPLARDDLNRITHPAIAKLAEDKLRELRDSGHPLIVYEAPLLFEASAESRVDRVLVVTTSPEIQLDRLVKRDRVSHDEALARIGSQMPLAEKARRADYIIDNSGSVAATWAQVDEIFRGMVSLAAQ